MSSFFGAGWLLARGRAGPAGRAPGPRRARARRPGATVLAPASAAGMVVTVALAACAGQGQARVVLPVKATGGPAQLADRPGPRQEVMAAYAGYWQAGDEALNAGNARQARRILAQYAPAAALPGLIAALRQDWARHAVSYGSPVLHVLSVKIRGRRATVHDCVDLSQAGLRNARTGRVFPRSFGSPRADYYASLVRPGRRWLVSNIVPVVAPCEP
jgi:hypothetical protein